MKSEPRARCLSLFSRELLCAVIVSACAQMALAQSIVTVAGGGTSSLEGLPATTVILSGVSALATDARGNVYVSDTGANSVYRISVAEGSISVFAGNGGGTFSGDGGPATQASLKNPRGLVFDDAGNLYIADSGNGRVRKVDAITGRITTFAGDPDRSDIGDNGPATAAPLFSPAGLAWNQGSLYITETTYDHNGVRKVDPQGIITTVAGKHFEVSGFSGDGGLATEAVFSEPGAIAVDGSGNLYIADSANSRIRRVDATSRIITTVVGGGSPADDVGDGGLGTDAKLARPTALVFDAAGKLIIADAYNQRGLVRKYDPASRVISTIAGNGDYGGGDGGPAKDAGIYAPFALTIDANQNIFVHDGSNNSVRRIDAATQIITRFAGGGTFIGEGRVAPAAVLSVPVGLAVDTRGDLLITDPGHSLLRKVSAETGIIRTIAGRLNDCCGGGEGPLATESSIGFPLDVAIAPNGAVYFASGSVRRLNADGTLTTYAGGAQPADGVGDGGPATNAALEAQGISFDASGNLFIADYNYDGHHRIRKVDTSGTISTIAGSDSPGYSGDNGPAKDAQLDSPRSVVVDKSGNIFISDSANGAIRRIDAQTNVITTYAGRGEPADGIGDGGAATAAAISPLHMTIDRNNDDLYFADQNGHRVRKIDARTQVITTVAGRGTWYLDGDFSGDNGPAKDAKLNFAYDQSGVALDRAGRVYVSDSQNNRVRMIEVCGTVAAPQLTEPGDGATTSTGPKLGWAPSAGASRYDVFLDTVNPPVRIAASDLGATSFVPANLQPGTTYFWRVVAKGDPFCPTLATSASRVTTFTTSSRCAADSFELIAPPAGSSTNTASVTLSWQASAGASTYDVYLGTSTAPSLIARGLTSTSFVATVTTGQYSWFVVAHAACDPTRTAVTSLRIFQSTVPNGCSPGQLQVTPSAPAGGATNLSTSVELVWSSIGATTGYDLYFGTSQAPPLLATGLTETRQTVNALLPGTTYFWRVVARGPCDPNGVTSATRSFTTRSCAVPGDVTIVFAPPSVSEGATYTLVWSIAAGLDADGAYLVERSTSPAFAAIADSQVTSSTAASFIANSVGTYYHRVRALAACNPDAPGALSAVKSVAVTSARPNVVFTVAPAAVITALGDRIENRRGTFALENLGSQTLQVIVGRQELGSPPFFSIVDPSATDAAFVTLEPRTPKTFEIRYAGPPNDQTASYQGVIFVAATGSGLSVTPYAFVNLKIGGGATVTPKLLVDGVEAGYVAFPGFAGDDTNRPARTITIANPGASPMDLAAEIAPEVWLVPEANWNATPLAPGESRAVRLFTRRSRSPNGSPLPRYTYFTVRTRDGASARLLVQDNDDVPLGTGRTTRLDLADRSFVIPEVVSRTTADGAPLVSRLRMSNVGGESVQTELIFTPAGADGFDATVRRATVVLPANDSLTLTDPLQQVFRLARPAIGSLEVRIPQTRLGLVAVSSTVVALGAKAGYVTPTVNRGEGAREGSPHLLAGVISSGSTTTSLTLAETSGVEAANVRISFTDANGTPRGATTVSVPRYGTRRFDNIATLIGGAPLQGGRIDVTVESGGGSVVGMAIAGTVDGGATFVSRPASEGATSSALAQAYGKREPSATTPPPITSVVPVITKPVSAGSSPTFQTSVAFVAPALVGASFTAVYRPAAAGSSAVSRTVDVGAGVVRVYTDILAELFGIPSGNGSVSVQTSAGGKVIAFLRATLGSATSLATSLPFPSTISEALTSAGGGAQRTLFYDGLDQSIDPARGTRWMLVLNEVTGNAGLVNVRLYEAGNRSSPIASRDVSLREYQQLQLDTVFSELGLDAPERRKERTNVQVVVTAIGGKARVAAMAVSVDNQNGDTKAFALTPSIGSATPSVSIVGAVIPPTPTPSAPRRRAVRR